MAVCSHCGKKIENGHIVAFDQSTGRVFHTNFHDVDHDGTLLLVGLRSLAETGFIPDSLMHLREAIEHHLKLNHQLEQGKGAGPLKNIDKLEKISRDWA